MIAADPGWLAGFALVLLATGLIAGVVAGLLGVGGGIVIVPVLFHLLGLAGVDPAIKMHLAVGTSLATIIPTAITSMRAHARRGAVDHDLLRLWAPAVFLGVVAGTALAAFWAKGTVLTAVFATVALLVAANMAIRPEPRPVVGGLPGRWAQWALAMVIGGFSAMMGIGGGTLGVPILSAFAYPIRRAVGTASAIGLIVSLPGTIGFVAAGLGHDGLPFGSLGYVNLVGVALIVPASILTVPLGAKLAHSMPVAWLRRAFALFLLLTAGRMFYGLI
ncbi:MAG: sulfite exporter TauE/SafE family protein [Alphaproteobacteria bacterium]|nr:sulfite exporter TauE/SafE family protein [Alphaproteobacteria bacterium]